MAFCPFNSSALPGLSWISVLVGRREQEGQDEEDLQGKSYDCAYCYPVPHQRPNVLFEIWSSLVLPGIFETKVVKSRFQQEPIIASEIEECTRKTWYQDLEMLIYEFGKVFFILLWCFWTLLHIRQIPSTQVYWIPRRSFYDVFEIPKAELFVDDLSCFWTPQLGIVLPKIELLTS